MIQRIQTLYLFLAFVVTGILLLFPLWNMSDGKDYFYAKSVYIILLGLSTTPLVSLVSYKKDRINLSWAVDL
jgi:hypothetical protein